MQIASLRGNNSENVINSINLFVNLLTLSSMCTFVHVCVCVRANTQVHMCKYECQLCDDKVNTTRFIFETEHNI